MLIKDIIAFWKNANQLLIIEIGLTVLLIVLFLIARKIVSRLINRHATTRPHALSRVPYVIKISNFGLGLIFITFVAIVWEISFRGLSIYFASFFTIVGVAFFASWSLLSNVTAYAILFFYFPFKIGSNVRILDGDNSVEGKIEDITFFFLMIKLTTGERITYPNNLALQKPILELNN